MTSGFSTIAGSVLLAYISFGVPPQNLVTSSVMSIPASIAISKIRIPETEEPVTRGRVIIDRGKVAKEKEPANALHAFSLGALFGVIIVGQVLANVLTVLSLVSALVPCPTSLFSLSPLYFFFLLRRINGLLTWIGRGFGIHQLTLQLIVGYIFYPITFFLGVPRAEILKVSRLFATKLIANEFAAYMELSALQKTADALSPRAYTIASYGLCGFANFGSLAIQVGVLGALGPSKGQTISRIAFFGDVVRLLVYASNCWYSVCGFFCRISPSDSQEIFIRGMLL